MTKFTLANVRVFAGGCDLTGASNKIDASADIDDKDVTTFGSTGPNGDIWKEVLGGLGSSTLKAEGLWEAGDPSKVDDALWAANGSVIPWSVLPRGGGAAAPTYGDLAWLTKALNTKYNVGGGVGDAAPWSADASGSGRLPRGAVLHPPGTARTATGTGTGVQLGAVPTGKSLYAALHVLSVAGTATPTITVAVESDTTNAFAAPTTVGTFTAATAIGGQSLLVAGPATNTWYRAKWTIAGTTPSFLLLVTAGIA